MNKSSNPTKADSDGISSASHLADNDNPAGRGNVAHQHCPCPTQWERTDRSDRALPEIGAALPFPDRREGGKDSGRMGAMLLKSLTPKRILEACRTARSVRNAWGYIQGQQSAWANASANARMAATNLVNAYLSHSDVGAMDLGVLTDMEGIRDKARIKLRALQEKYLLQYLKSYDAMVNAVSEMRNLSGSMRTYVKDSSGGPLIEFTKSPMVGGDTGDGGGVAVFGTLPLRTCEMLVNELVIMFEKELRVKWLMASEFHTLVYQSIEAASSKGKHLHFGYVEPLAYKHGNGSKELGEADKVSHAVLNSRVKLPSRETLEVYLTALLAEVHISKDRVSEVSRLWSEEMTGVAGSPLR